MSLRNILIFSTTGQAGQTVESRAQTWGELQKDFDEKGIYYEGMKAVTSPGKVSLESPESELPEGNFTLFLMPKQTKSGE